MNDMEKLAIVQAIYKSIAEDVSTKNPDGLRRAVDEQMAALYEQTGAKSFDMKVNGEKVGTYSLTIAKPTEGTVEKRFEVEDPEAAVDSADYALYHLYAKAHAEDFAAWVLEEHGEMLDGCRLTDYAVPGDAGGYITRTTIRVDPTKVAEAVGPALGSDIRMLLGGGHE